MRLLTLFYDYLLFFLSFELNTPTDKVKMRKLEEEITLKKKSLVLVSVQVRDIDMKSREDNKSDYKYKQILLHPTPATQ